MTQESRFDLAAPPTPLGDLGRVHFIAIGGAGMSAVARLVLAAGHRVSGSDVRDSAALRSLEASGAVVSVGHAAEHLGDADTVVVSSAIREDNPELVAARSRGLRVLHRSQALAALGTGRRVVAVAGANGKTTTTSMLVVALAAAGADPTFASGADIPQLGTNAALGSGTDFVVEADESDGSFVVYRPDVALVTNVQADHLDFYGDLAGVEAAYRRFVGSMAADGLLVTCEDDDGARALGEVARASGRRVLTYGAGEGADIRLLAPTVTEDGGHAGLLAGGERWELRVQVPGRHNLENAAGAYGALTAGCGLDARTALDGLAGFVGAARRFESHGEPGGIRVIDDYAHNAPKVTAAVRTGAEMARRRRGRLLVVFQPHLYTRTRDFALGFAGALAPADEVVLLDIYGAREDPLAGITSDLIAGPLREVPGERVVHRVTRFDDAVRLVSDSARRGDVVMTIGAGDVTVLAPRIAAALTARPGADR
jgi:UDP-N-acetylmuramate--alanine ligase